MGEKNELLEFNGNLINFFFITAAQKGEKISFEISMISFKMLHHFSMFHKKVSACSFLINAQVVTDPSIPTVLRVLGLQLTCTCYLHIR